MVMRILIKGVTVLDGNGVPAYEADVRVTSGQIVEVGWDLVAADGERVFEAMGQNLTPHYLRSLNSGAARRLELSHPL
jgi:N-acyl-D-amino-acid deacylase